MKQYLNSWANCQVDLLEFDDFGLANLDKQQTNGSYGIIEDRQREMQSTIIASQTSGSFLV